MEELEHARVLAVFIAARVKRGNRSVSRALASNRRRTLRTHRN